MKKKKKKRKRWTRAEEVQESRGDSSKEGGGARERGDQESLSFLRWGRWWLFLLAFHVLAKADSDFVDIRGSIGPINQASENRSQRSMSNQCDPRVTDSRGREMNADRG